MADQQDELSSHLYSSPPSSRHEPQQKGETFAATAVDLLLDEVEKWRTVITNAGKDTSTMTEKRKAWKDIESCFNSDDRKDKRRTDSQLEKKWKNLLQKAKAAQAKDKQSRIGTGGGRLLPCSLTDQLKRVLSVAGDDTNPFPMPFDSDRDHHDGEERGTGTQADKEEECRRGNYMMEKRSKKRKIESLPDQEARTDLQDMRRSEHKLRMDVLQEEKLFLVRSERSNGSNCRTNCKCCPVCP